MPGGTHSPPGTKGISAFELFTSLVYTCPRKDKSTTLKLAGRRWWFVVNCRPTFAGARRALFCTSVMYAQALALSIPSVYKCIRVGPACQNLITGVSHAVLPCVNIPHHVEVKPMCRKSEQTTVIAVRVPVVERERLALLAAQRHESISELARRALATLGNEVQHANP